MLSLFASLPLAAAENESSLGLSYVETKDVRLIYFDPLGYLVAARARTFTNSLAWQRRMFGWDAYRADDHPAEGLRRLRQRVRRAGAAQPAASSTSRRCRAPSRPIAASERMYSTDEPRAGPRGHGRHRPRRGRRWRRFFGGKVAPQSQHPGDRCSTAISRSPRFTVPRWYLEGSAVFMETWMAGGLGRAQGGYDEMVFRAMVRDGAPLLRSARAGVAGHARRLPGRRQRLPLRHALLHLARLRAFAGKSGRVAASATRAGGRYYADSSSRCSACRSSEAWQRLDRLRARVPARAISPRCASTRSRRTRARRRRALGSVSRACLRARSGDALWRRSAIPGVVEHVGAIDLRDGSCGSSPTSRARCSTASTSFAYDPRQRHRLLHRPTTSRCATHGGRRATPATRRMLLRGRAHRRDRASTRRTARCWACATRTGSPRWCASRIPTRAGTRCTRSPTASCPTTSTSRPTGACCPRRWARRTATSSCASAQIDKLLRGRRRAARASPLRPVGAGELRLLAATAATSTAAATTPASRTSSATRSPPARSRRSRTPRPGFFRPVPLADGRLVVLRLHRRGIRAGDDRAASRWRTSSAITLPRRGGRRRSIRS